MNFLSNIRAIIIINELFEGLLEQCSWTFKIIYLTTLGAKFDDFLKEFLKGLSEQKSWNF